MPLKLIPPDPARRTTSYTIRGTYLKEHVHRSAGTSREADARKELKKIEAEIEQRRWKRKDGPTFESAAVTYMNHGGQPNFVKKLITHFKGAQLDAIDQAAVDHAAVALYPKGAAATRNRQVYTPISAILRHAGIEIVLKRPSGSQGAARTSWLRPEEAERLLQIAWGVHPRFAALCTFLLYTGCRLSEALDLQISDLHLKEGFAHVGITKNGQPRGVFLPPVVVHTLKIALWEPANASYLPLKVARSKGSVFCLTKAGILYDMLDAVAYYAKVEIPVRVAFHIFRHSYGAWLRRYGRLDTAGLIATGAWTSRGGVASYEHVDVSASARAAGLMPGANTFTDIETVDDTDTAPV